MAFQDKPEVDLSYVRCLKASCMAGSGYPMVASHDPRLIADRRYARRRRRPHVGQLRVPDALRRPPDEQQRLAAAGNRIRASTCPTATEWYGYFMRRLAERPANLAFFLRSLATKN